jgi:hypothetical protein
VSEIFGLLVNPRDGSLYYAEKQKTRTVVVYSLADDEEGKGYFNHEEKYAQPSRITGLPRVHTPGGVSEKGKGTGTVLYTGLCLAASLNHRDKLSLSDLDVDGDGISSGAGRSDDAERWWTRAKTVYGLAVEVEGCDEEGFEIETSSGRYEHHAEAIAREYLKADKARVSDYTLTASGTQESCGLKADAYPYKKAARASLVVARVQDDDATYWHEVGARGIDVASKKALAAANVGQLKALEWARGASPEGVFAVLLKAARAAGLSRRDLDGLVLRFLAGVDIDPATWKHPDFAYYSPVRDNPRIVRASGRGRRRGPRMKITEPTVRMPKRLPAPKVKHYGRVRANPAPDARAVRTEIARLHEARAELGWAAWASDAGAP